MVNPPTQNVNVYTNNLKDGTVNILPQIVKGLQDLVSSFLLPPHHRDLLARHAPPYRSLTLSNHLDGILITARTTKIPIDLAHSHVYTTTLFITITTINLMVGLGKQW